MRTEKPPQHLPCRTYLKMAIGGISPMPLFAGVDGCRAGWIAAHLAPDGFQPFTLHETLADLFKAAATVDRVLIDIPIGLREQGPERACDTLGRRLLSPRGSTLFPVPIRAAVHAPNFASAKALNRGATGRGLSIQTWSICPKIAQADRLLRSNPGLGERLHESHPEICFAALNGWQPLLETKKSPEGRKRRLELLREWVSNSDEALSQALATYPRKAVAQDDLLDAMVLALSARMAQEAGLPTIPARPEHDTYGLSMVIMLPIRLKEG